MFRMLVSSLFHRFLQYTDMSTVSAMQDEHKEGDVVGLDLETGEAIDPELIGVFDSYRVLRNSIASSSSIATNLLLCDELLKARQMGRAGGPGPGMDGPDDHM